MNRGGVRNPGFTLRRSPAGEGNGNVTYGEAFTVQPFGNSLVTMTLTAQQIKNLLEQQFAGCRGQARPRRASCCPRPASRTPGTASKACDSRISNVTLVRGGVDRDDRRRGRRGASNPRKTYRVTVNNFMATGGDGYTTLLGGTNPLGGAQDIDALVAYMADFKAPNAPYNPADPALAKPRLNRINAPVGSTTCPGGANVNP